MVVDHNDATYLGDGIYAYFDGYQVELFAHNGICKTNSVFLDDVTLKHFMEWIEELKEIKHK